MPALKRILPDLQATQAQRIAELEAQLAKANQPQARSISFKIGEKGAMSVYGLGRFPVTLYGSQWDILLGQTDKINAFLAANRDKLAVKQ